MKVGAVTPLNFTDVAPVKLVPVITTVFPATPDVWAKLVIVGGVPRVTTKLVADVRTPDVADTVIAPVVAPVGTIAVMEVSEFTVKLVAACPLNETPVAPVNPTPVMVTEVATGPKAGEKELSAGVTTVLTVKADGDVDAPSVV